MTPLQYPWQPAVVAAVSSILALSVVACDGEGGEASHGPEHPAATVPVEGGEAGGGSAVPADDGASAAVGEPELRFALDDEDYWPDLHGYPGVGEGRIVIGNSLDDTLSILDLSKIGDDDFAVMATVPIGHVPVDIEGPQGIAVDPDGEHYYVGLNKFVLNADSAPGGHGISVADGFVLKVRASDNATVGQVRVDRVPSVLTLTPDGERLLVSHHDLQPVARFLYGEIDDPEEQKTALAIVEPDTMSIEASITLCPGTHGIAVSPDGQTAYVTCVDDRIAIVDLASEEHTTTFVPVVPEPGTPNEPVCFPYALTLAPSGERLWVSCLHTGEVRCYDTVNGEMDEALTAALPGAAAFGVFDATGEELLVPYQQSHGIGRIDPATGQVLQDIDLPVEQCSNPREIHHADGGARLIVLCEGSHTSNGSVTIVDARTGELERSVELGLFPIGIGILGGAQ